MEAAKNAVKNIVSRGGQHDTHVEEVVAPAVTSETVKPHRHEETQEAIDREVHQHHYHTTVQPVAHREVIPEKHTHQQMPVQEKEFRHGDDERIRQSVDNEAAKFANTSTTHNTTHSTAQAAQVAGEHVHHHVHETVQPVIHKETVRPEVVHTTVPIHEVHHAQAEHHGISTLPTKTLDEFKKVGGALTGAGTHHENYEGHPRPYNPEFQSERSAADTNPAAHDGIHHPHAHHSIGHSGTGTSTGTGLTGTGTGASTGASSGLGLGHNSETGVGHTGVGHSSTGTGAGIGGTSTSSTGLGSGSHNTSGNYQTLDPSRNSNTVSQTSTNTADRLTSADHPRQSEREAEREVRDDVQTPRQGQDPAMVGEPIKKLTGEGTDGSHSAVFGLTPDGHKHEDTAHGVGKLTPAHTGKGGDNKDLSGGAADSKIAAQMQDVNRKQGMESDSTGTDTRKIGAGATGGQQGFGDIRPGEHGTESKISSKLDPTTDADGDGKRGVMD